VIKLVQSLTPVKVQIVVVIDRWNKLYIVVDLCDVQHGLELKVHGDEGHRWRKFFLFDLLLACGRADWLA